MQTLVTGATGLIGRHLVDVLTDAGVGVRAYVRPSSDTRRLLAQGAALAVGDAEDTAAMARAVAGADVVFHVAGYLTANAPFGTDANASAEEWARYRRVNVAFTERLLHASLEAGVGRFVYVSSSSVYSPDAPVPTPEDALLAPTSQYGRSKLLAETAVATFQEQGLSTTTVRPPVAYGPGDRYFTPLALRLARLPLLPLVNGGSSLMDLVYARDVAELLWCVGEAETADGRVYNAGPGRETTLRDLVAAYHTLTGEGPRIVAVSPHVAGRTAWLSRRLVKPFVAEAEAALTREGLALMDRDLHLDMTRAAVELGFRPRFTLQEGLAETLAVGD